MRSIKRVIKLKHQGSLSARQVARALKIAKSTVCDYLSRYEDSELTLSDLEDLTEQEIYAALFPETGADTNRPPRKSLPDFALMHSELRKRHVTRQLLWEEYRSLHPDGYAYTQFCNLYRKWARKLSISMRQIHKAGQKMFVDYSGLTAEIIDQKTGEVRKAEVFVASLGASGYTYAEACPNQKRQSFINAHIRAFEYYGGVTELLIPDNLKSAVIKADLYDPILGESYQDMAEHYGTAVMPARPGRPKDKAKVELSVKLVQRWILARIRHRRFFSLYELNETIRSLLDDLNGRVIKKLGKSRRQLYEEIDRPALKPLPSQRYILREFKLCRVSMDYHIELESCYYSVPYQLAGEQVEARYTQTSVEIFCRNRRVAVHKRLPNKWCYSTQRAHMASAHRAYADWTPSRICNWALSFGTYTARLVKAIMEEKPHPEMGFRTCIGIISTAKRQDNPEAVELAARKMLELRSFRVGHFRSILKNRTYIREEDLETLQPPSNHHNVRGSGYYA